MKVNPESPQISSALLDAKAAPAKSQASEAGSAGAASGTQAAAGIELSSASRGLQASDGSDPASFDSARVDQIKQAISQGRFQVNAHVVADKLIASAQDLVSSASGKGH
jgi:negative regulator of flagellin synthesis FlgM